MAKARLGFIVAGPILRASYKFVQGTSPPLYVNSVMIEGIHFPRFRVHKQWLAVAIIPDAEAARKSIDRKPFLT